VFSLPSDIALAVAELKSRLAASFGARLERVVLFGSYARGRAHEDSDVDVLVLVSRREPDDGRRAVDAAVAVMLERPDVVLSTLVMTPDELALLRARERRLALEIDRDGIAL
jgi:predicted nucleotidyltransferase